jgi:hypothetical protein
LCTAPFWRATRSSRNRRSAAPTLGPLPSPDGNEIPPTGNRVEIPYVAIYTARGDQIVSWRLYWDQMAVMSQLGLLEQWPDRGQRGRDRRLIAARRTPGPVGSDQSDVV